MEKQSNFNSLGNEAINSNRSISSKLKKVSVVD